MDQRRFPRIEVEFPGFFRGDHIDAEGVVLNLSWAGCALESELVPRVGAFGELEIQLPDGDIPVKVDVAVVRWSQGSRFGLDFLKISRDDEERLRQLVGTGWFQGLKNLFSSRSKASSPQH